jgi:hypothetical protein
MVGSICPVIKGLEKAATGAANHGVLWGVLGAGVELARPVGVVASVA